MPDTYIDSNTIHDIDFTLPTRKAKEPPAAVTVPLADSTTSYFSSRSLGPIDSIGQLVSITVGRIVLA